MTEKKSTREPHPRFRRLLDVADGLLDDPRVRTARDHVEAGCTRCVAELGSIAALRDAVVAGPLTSPPRAVVRRASRLFAAKSLERGVASVRRIVAALVFDRGLAAAPALRSGGGGRRLLWTFGELELFATLTDGRSGAVLRGQLLPRVADDAAPAGDVRVLRNGRVGTRLPRRRLRVHSARAVRGHLHHRGRGRRRRVHIATLRRGRMSSTDPPDLVDLVHVIARRLPTFAKLKEMLGDASHDWRAAEAALARAMLRSPQSGARLVRAFGALADASACAEARGRSACLRGALAMYGADAEGALPHYERAARELRGAARDGARLGRASAFLRLGRFDDARAVCAAVRRSARRRGDGLVAAAADLNDGVALHESGRAGRAVPVYWRALDGLTEAGHAHLAATAAQNLANALVLLDRFDEAEPLYARASEGFAGLGLDHESARCDVNRGALFTALDRLGDADGLLFDAERRLSAGGDAVQAALCRLDRGEALLRAGLLPEALHALDSARRGLSRGAPPAERRRAALAIARTQILLGDAESAARVLRRVGGETRAERAQVTELRGHVSVSRGRLALALRQFGDAADAYGRARPASRGRALVAAAQCAVRRDDVADARRLLRRADRAAHRLGLARLDFGVAALRFRIEVHVGRRRAADAALDEALAALERVRVGLGGDVQRAALLEGREEFIVRAVRHRLEGPDGARRALELLEHFRGRALRDLAADVGRVLGGESDLDRLRARVAGLESAIGERGSLGLLRGSDGGRGSSAARRLAAAERALLRAADAVRGTAGSPPVTLSALRSAIPAGVRLVSVFSDDVETCLFVVGPDGVHVVRAPVSRDAVAALVDTLHFRLARFTAGPEFVARHVSRLARDTDRALSEIADVFVAPLMQVLDETNMLVVVPSGPWHHVPFAALPYRSARLVEYVPVALTPALGMLEPGVRRARGAPLVCGFADANAPSIAHEARRVASALPRARRLVGPDATFAAVRARRRPACLHLAAHGRHRVDAPAMSGVRLADGWLRAADLSTLDLTGSLVVLSGCETGVSAVRAGDELHGLVRGAFAAGARDLVASLWRVSDEATTELMVSFHRARQSGLPAAAALAAAQAEQAGRGRHPWLWAGFSAWTRALD